MKKLITLLLVLTGMVCTAMAEEYVTIRIYALREVYDGWGNDVKIVVNYWDGSQNVGINDQVMTWIAEAESGKHMFYADLKMDKTKYDDAMNKTGIKYSSTTIIQHGHIATMK